MKAAAKAKRGRRSPAPAALLCLPPELLHTVWCCLGGPYFDSYALADQHALRCSCRALRDASTQWIDSMRVATSCVDQADLPPAAQQAPHRRRAPQPVEPTAPATPALKQLSRFPASAVLRKLEWSHRHDTTYEYSDELEALSPCLRSQLPAFLFQSRNRLACLSSFAFNVQGLDYGDVSALADTCPQLRSLDISGTQVIGPAFAPLQRLPSLSTLRLASLYSPVGQTPLILSSLPSALTALTELRVEVEMGVVIAFIKPGGVALPPVDLLPWVSSLRGLRHLVVNLDAQDLKDHAAAGEAVVRHIGGLPALTHLEVCGGILPSPCPPLACATSLAELSLATPDLDTQHIRLFAAMPQLTSVDLGTLLPDTDLSTLPCSWKEAQVRSVPTLQRLLWIPRGIQSLSLLCPVDWQLSEGDSLDSACSLLRQAAQLFAEKPGWDSATICVTFDAAPSFSSPSRDPGAASSAPLSAEHAEQQDSGWSRLFQALAPLQQRLDNLTFNDSCQLDAEISRQGTAWLTGLPELCEVSFHPKAPGFEEFVAALGETAWLGLLCLNSPSSRHPRLPKSMAEALRRMAVQRASAGHRLE